MTSEQQALMTMWGDTLNTRETEHKGIRVILPEANPYFCSINDAVTVVKDIMASGIELRNVAVRALAFAEIPAADPNPMDDQLRLAIEWDETVTKSVEVDDAGRVTYAPSEPTTRHQSVIAGFLLQQWVERKSANGWRWSKREVRPGEFDIQRATGK